MGATQYCSVEPAKNQLCEIFGVVQFSTFATLSPDNGHCQGRSVFPSLYGPIEFGDKPCQACCSPRTGFAQTLKNAYPFGTRCRAGIWESGA